MRARLRGAEPAAHTYAPLFSDTAQQMSFGGGIS